MYLNIPNKTNEKLIFIALIQLIEDCIAWTVKIPWYKIDEKSDKRTWNARKYIYIHD